MADTVKYKPTDKLRNLVRDNSSLLMVMSRFGISSGFGEKSVDEVCNMHGVDVATFLAVANLILRDWHDHSACPAGWYANNACPAGTGIWSPPNCMRTDHAASSGQAAG